MIRLKNKKCIECGREDQPWFSKKRCKWCSQKSYKKPAKVSNKQKEKLKTKKETLDPFFDYHVGRIYEEPFCNNCGIRINSSYRWSCAHILPKSKYKSVMANLDNCVYLCTFGKNCHGKFDSIQKTQEVYKMKVWDVAYKKFLKFKHLVKEKGKEFETFENYEKRNI